jgi:RNA-binding protein
LRGTSAILDSMSLTNPQIRQLKSFAQRLEPVLHLGKAGVTEAFLKSVEQELNNHELIKLKFAAFKDEKKTLAADIAARTNSELVWIVGHVAVLYRAHPEPARRRVELAG